MATSSANRGKSAESIIRGLLNKFSDANTGFCFDRVPDAHAAGGRFVALPGDFQAFRKLPDVIEMREGVPPMMFSPARKAQSRNFIIEVKEVKHDFRLPHKNYSADKVARVQKRVWAGSEAIVVVLHTTSGLWRLVPFDVFTTRSGGSWDLSEHPTGSIETGLAEFMGLE